MFFLNLSLGEFLTLLGAVSGLVTALYLLDRAKRKKVVSTLRFWTPALTANEQQSRKRMRDPWSLILQLISLFLLLLAIAQLQWGKRERSGRDHVVLIDSSAWTAQRRGNGTLLDEEKRVALAYIDRLPSRDRVLLAAVDGLTTPLTPFAGSRARLQEALGGIRPSFAALDMDQALAFAKQAENWSSAQRGEVVYIGPRRVENADQPLSGSPGLRTISVAADNEDCGIRGINVRHGENDQSTWQATVSLKNYGLARRAARVEAQFAGTRFAPRPVVLAGGEESTVEYSFVTNAAGQLVVSLQPADSLGSDDRAVLQLPKGGVLRVAVFTRRPEVLHSWFGADHEANAQYLPPEAYNPSPAADVMVLDQMTRPAQLPRIPSFWIDPPAGASPMPVKHVSTDATITNWHAESPLGAGLHAKETRIASAKVYETFEGDIPVGSIGEGPVVVARPAAGNNRKLAVIGFDPLSGPFRFEVTTPLLFANLLRWLEPESFRTLEVSAGTAGAASVILDPSERPERVRVTDQNGYAVPFTIRKQTVQLFSERPAVVRVSSGDRERVLSLTIPNVAQYEWKPPANTPEGLPSAGSLAPSAIDLWKWLAGLGALGLLCEWVLFGRQRFLPVRRNRKGTAAANRNRVERELVSK